MGLKLGLWGIFRLSHCILFQQRNHLGNINTSLHPKRLNCATLMLTMFYDPSLTTQRTSFVFDSDNLTIFILNQLEFIQVQVCLAPIYLNRNKLFTLNGDRQDV